SSVLGLLALWRRQVFRALAFLAAATGAAVLDYFLGKVRFPARERAVDSQREQEEAKGSQADDASAAIVAALRAGQKPAGPYWLFLRSFHDENRISVVSTFNTDLQPQEGFRPYREVNFFNTDRQPVDLFDGLQSGLRDLTRRHFVAVG